TRNGTKPYMIMNENENKHGVHSKVLRAGRRTYFFDVRSTKADDYYLTITESKKFTNEDGSFYFKKHKIFLYKEDFKDFESILNEMTSFIIAERGEVVISDKHDDNFNNEEKEEKAEVTENNFTDISFDDI